MFRWWREEGHISKQQHSTPFVRIPLTIACLLSVVDLSTMFAALLCVTLIMSTAAGIHDYIDNDLYDERWPPLPWSMEDVILDAIDDYSSEEETFGFNNETTSYNETICGNMTTGADNGTNGFNDTCMPSTNSTDQSDSDDWLDIFDELSSDDMTSDPFNDTMNGNDTLCGGNATMDGNDTLCDANATTNGNETLGGGNNGTGIDNTTCVPSATCYSDADCADGICLGLALSTCNCGACLSLLPCKDDSQCGGLRGACNTEFNFCDCSRGFIQNGFTSVLDALLKFCNKEQCNATSDTCYGLPCNKGACLCL